jgi:hypothetical protein
MIIRWNPAEGSAFGTRLIRLRKRENHGSDGAALELGGGLQRLIADTHRSTLELHGLGSKATNVESNQPSEGDSEAEGGPTCLARRMRLRASAKARTQ